MQQQKGSPKDGILFAGNYDTYLQVRSELEDAQAKKHKWEQDQISHMKVGSLPVFEPQRAGSRLQTLTVGKTDQDWPKLLEHAPLEPPRVCLL